MKHYLLILVLLFNGCHETKQEPYIESVDIIFHDSIPIDTTTNIDSLAKMYSVPIDIKYQ